MVADRPGLRVVLLADVEEVRISKAWSDAGMASRAPHLHRRHVESYYVLEGEMALTAGDRELRAPAGSWVHLLPGVPHTVSFPGSEPVRLLNLHTPNCGFRAFVRALHSASDQGGTGGRTRRIRSAAGAVAGALVPLPRKD